MRIFLQAFISIVILMAFQPFSSFALDTSFPIFIDSPGKGFISLGIFNSEGQQIRTIAYAKETKGGKHGFIWDGTTDLGLPVAPGTYTANGIFFIEQPKLEWVMKVAKNGNPPYRTADGKGDWGGNLSSPTGLCSNSKSIVMSWGCVEDNQITGVQEMDADGNIICRYYTFYPWDSRWASAMDDNNLYLGILNWGKGLEIAEYKIGTPRGKILAKLPSKMVKTPKGRWKYREMNSIDGIAITADRIFATVGTNNELFIIERATGNILKKVDAPSPFGLAVYGDRLLVVSDGQVVKYTLDGTKESVLVPKGKLTAPYAIAVAKDGTMFVGDSGQPNGFDIDAESGSKQIYVFDAKGALKGKIGKEGGAPRSGKFDSQALGDISSMCMSPDGKTLFVNDVSTGFSRTSRWSLDGKLEKEWFCRKLECSPDAVNPARPNETVKVGGPFDDLMTVQCWDMDFAKKSWRPAWRYTMKYEDNWQEDVVKGYGHGGNYLKDEAGKILPWPIFGYGAECGMATVQGRNYMMSGEGAIFTYAPDQAPKLVGMVFPHRCEMKDGKIQTYYDQGPNNWFTWADRNGDGKVQIDETIVTEKPEPLTEIKRMARMVFDDKMNIIIMTLGKPDPANGQVSQLCILPLKEILPNGAPVYDWSQLKYLDPNWKYPSMTGGDGQKKVPFIWTSNLIPTRDAYYTILDPSCDKKLKLPGIDGDGWWAGRNWRKKIAKFDKETGKCLWSVGRRAPSVAEPGQMYNPISLGGVAKDAVFAADAMGVVWVWSTDGFYLGQLFNGPENKKPDEYSLYIELQGVNIVSTPDGKLYCVANDCGTSVQEIKLPKTQSLKGPAITVTAEQAAKIKPWDPDGVMPTSKPVYHVRRVSKAPTINGEFDGREGWWSFEDGTKNEEALILLDGERMASVRMMYDDKNLYMGYTVRSFNGTLNSGSELPACPFVSGAYVDAYFAPDWAQPQRGEVKEGDMRIIMAQVKGAEGKAGNFQQGYWQKMKGGTNGQDIKSPAAAVHFDQIKEVPGLQFAYRDEGKKDDTGRNLYTVEVAIPLEAIGIANPAGKKIGFDMSVAAANESGDRRERAAHWAGLSEGIVVDRPGSIKLLPENWGTLEFMAK